MASLAEIKNWFKTGLKPTQIQFWATWDSFWHKDEVIPQSRIQNLITDLENKAEKGAGSRFGIEDNKMPDGINHRFVDMNGKNMKFDHAGDFIINNYTPYGNIEELTAQDEGAVILENDETEGVCTIYRADGSNISYTPPGGYLQLLVSKDGAPYFPKGFYVNYDANNRKWTYRSEFLSGGSYKYQGFVGEKYSDIIAGIPPVMDKGMGQEVVVVEGDKLKKTPIYNVLPATTLNEVTNKGNVSRKNLIISRSGTADTDDNYAEYYDSGYRLYGGYSREPKYDVYIGLQHEMGSAYKGRHFYVWPASPRRNDPGSNPYIIPITVNGKPADKEGNITIDGGSSGTATWGTISGEIEAQQDLVQMVNGNKFGTGDNEMDDDRSVDMDYNSFTYNKVGTFALLGDDTDASETDPALILVPVRADIPDGNLLNRTFIFNEDRSAITNSNEINFELTITENEDTYTDYYTFTKQDFGDRGGIMYCSNYQLWDDENTISIEMTGNYQYRKLNYADVRMQVPPDSGEPETGIKRVMLMNDNGSVSHASEALVLKELSYVELTGKAVVENIPYQHFGEYANIEIVGNDTGYPDYDNYTFLRLNIHYNLSDQLGNEVAVMLDVDGAVGVYGFSSIMIGEYRYFVYDGTIGTVVTPISYFQPTVKPAVVNMKLMEATGNDSYYKPIVTDESGNLFKGSSLSPGLDTVLNTRSSAAFNSITLNNTNEFTILNPVPYTSDPGGMMIKATTGNLAETFYKKNGISIQNAATGSVNLNFPTSGVTAATYNLNVPERNGTLATTDQIPVIPPASGLQEVLAVNSIAEKRGLVRIESKSNDQIGPGLAYGSAKLDLFDTGTGTNAELYVRDYFGFETFLKLGASDASGHGILVNAYNYGLRNVTDHSGSEFNNDLNYVTAGGVKKYFDANIGYTVPTSQTDTGRKGEIRVGSSYVYFCVDTNNWVRLPIDTSRWT